MSSTASNTGGSSSPPLPQALTHPAPDPAALQRLLASGPLTICIETESKYPGADPNAPRFLQGVFFDRQNPSPWFNTVLPHVRTFTLRIPDTTVIQFAGKMLGSCDLPQLHEAIVRLDLPGFHWFSGVQFNRHHNPYFQLAQHLRNLEHLTFRMHTAGLTVSKWSEREQIKLEATDLQLSKERRCISEADVAAHYELDALFNCKALQEIHIEYIDCAHTRYFCRTGDPVDTLHSIRDTLQNRFTNRGRTVQVQLHRI